MQFSDPTNRTGIVELLEDLTDTQSSTTASYPIAVKTRDINNALANYSMIAQRSSGSWESDDTNQVDYPIATLNVTSGTQNYSFTIDEQGNQILDIYRVELADANGIFRQLIPLEELNMNGVSLTEFMKTSGTAIYYKKTANGIFLYAPTNYNYTAGLKIYYSRTPTYFLSTDTTKRAGIPDMFHEYLALRPAYFYWLPKDSQRASLYANEITKFEGNERLGISGLIGEYFANRSRDTKTALKTIHRTSR